MKKNIIFFLLGAIIFSGISVYATLTYSANQITYTKGNNTMYLSDAIDELYTTQNTTIVNKDAQISNLQTAYNKAFNFVVTTRSGKGELMFDALRYNGYTKFKITNPYKSSNSTTCDMSQTMSSTTWTYFTNNFTFGQVYDIPNNNDRICLQSTNGVCDFQIFLYR